MWFVHVSEKVVSKYIFGFIILPSYSSDDNYFETLCHVDVDAMYLCKSLVLNVVGACVRNIGIKIYFGFIILLSYSSNDNYFETLCHVDVDAMYLCKSLELNVVCACVRKSGVKIYFWIYHFVLIQFR